MKKIVIVLSVTLIILTGCSSSDLEDYQQALLETESYTSGITRSEMSVDIEFNEIGLEFNEIRDLSYFETIEIATTTKYNYEDDRRTALIDAYLNFGGMGFDMIYYMNDKEMLVKLPIIDKYINVGYGTVSEDKINGDERQSMAIKKVIDEWNNVLNEEDVFSGNKAYIMTDKGQIKTTTYQVHINNEQFEILKSALLTIIADEEIVEAFLSDSEGMIDYSVTNEEIQEMMKEIVEAMSLENFEGQAFVDFDGRLVKQIFTADLVNEEAQAGEVKALHFTYETGFDQLGEVAPIVIPTIDPSEMLEMDEDSTIEDYFPEGIF